MDQCFLCPLPYLLEVQPGNVMTAALRWPHLLAAIAERDAAELAETLRHTITEGNVTPRPGTVYEQGSAELARAVRVLEAELRETTGELHMARQQLEEARSCELFDMCDIK
eukprot:1138350-Pelagomonas_calceolata.AAC.5